MVRLRISIVSNANGVRLANSLNSIVGRSTGATVDFIHTGTIGCGVSPSFCGGGSVRVRTARTTIPGSNPSTNIAVIATLISTLAGHGVEQSITVAKRIALENHIATVNNLHRGTVTTCHNKMGAICVPGRGLTSLSRISRGILRGIGFVPMDCIARVISYILLPTLRGVGSGICFTRGGSMRGTIDRWQEVV